MAWKAPKFISSQKGRLLQVTARTLGHICESVSLAPEHLQGRNIVSIGEGLSSFIKDACCTWKAYGQGVDPMYAFLESSYEDYKNHLSCIGLQLFHGSSSYYEKQYLFVREGVKRGTHITASGEHLPFRDTCADFVVVSNFLDHVKISLTKRVLSEAVRICKVNGEVRIPEVFFVDSKNNAGTSLSLCDEPINGNKWHILIRELQKWNCKVYTVKMVYRIARSLLPGVLYYYLKETGVEPVIYNGLIIRRDDKLPFVTSYPEAGVHFLGHSSVQKGVVFEILDSAFADNVMVKKVDADVYKRKRVFENRIDYSGGETINFETEER